MMSINEKATFILDKIAVEQRLVSGDPDEGINDWLQHHLEDENLKIKDPAVAKEVMRRLLEGFMSKKRFNRAATIFRYRHMKIDKENEEFCFQIFDEALREMTPHSHELCMAIVEHHIAKQPELLSYPKNDLRLNSIFKCGKPELINAVLDCIPTTGHDTQPWLEDVATSDAVYMEMNRTDGAIEERRELISRMFKLGIGSSHYHPDNRVEDLPSGDLIYLMSGDDIVELTRLNRISGPDRESDDRSRMMIFRLVGAIFRLVVDLDDDKHDPMSIDLRKKIDAAATLIEDQAKSRRKEFWDFLVQKIGHLTQHIEYLAHAYVERGGFEMSALLEKIESILDDPKTTADPKVKKGFSRCADAVKAIAMAREINIIVDHKPAIKTARAKSTI